MRAVIKESVMTHLQFNNGLSMASVLLGRRVQSTILNRVLIRVIQETHSPTRRDFIQLPLKPKADANWNTASSFTSAAASDDAEVFEEMLSSGPNLRIIVPTLIETIASSSSMKENHLVKYLQLCFLKRSGGSDALNDLTPFCPWRCFHKELSWYSFCCKMVAQLAVGPAAVSSRAAKTRLFKHYFGLFVGPKRRLGTWSSLLSSRLEVRSKRTVEVMKQQKGVGVKPSFIYLMRAVKSTIDQDYIKEERRLPNYAFVAATREGTGTTGFVELLKWLHKRTTSYRRCTRTILARGVGVAANTPPTKRNRRELVGHQTRLTNSNFSLSANGSAGKEQKQARDEQALCRRQIFELKHTADVENRRLLFKEHRLASSLRSIREVGEAENGAVAQRNRMAIEHGEAAGRQQRRLKDAERCDEIQHNRRFTEQRAAATEARLLTVREQVERARNRNLKSIAAQDQSNKTTQWSSGDVDSEIGFRLEYF
ncbi:hypothetical protein K469DRAFT_691585 [Zopfia rhizophila CBS 207.26]|uniref:Uncharacterized protein n=1 Tax=Zopfia rhizophila CBS 207.26 TaxID=1314779 RepID=A0A6A6DQS6_9PEZI|nr:hypothetical protein K469DRAFT_691585 [Zopfia rhizophila CBS 207.26]